MHFVNIPSLFRRYIKERERKEHLDQAMSFCSQSFKDLLKQHSVDKRDDTELLTLLIEIYQAHKKCAKQTAPKDSVFSSNLVETYKAYIQGKVERLPETVNYVDLAVKLCLQEINIKKSMERGAKRLSMDDSSVSNTSITTPRINISLPGISSQYLTSNNSPSQTQVQRPIAATITPTAATITPIVPASNILTPTIPGIPSRPRGRPPGSKNLSYSNLVPPPNAASPIDAMAGIFDNATLLMSLYSNPTFMQMLQQFTDPASLNHFLAEFIKLSKGNLAQLAGSSKMPSAPPVSTLPTAVKISQPKQPKTERSSSTTSPSVSAEKSSLSKLSANTSLQIIPTSSQTSIKPTTVSPSASTSSSTAVANAFQSGTSTVISVGSGQLTITPTLSLSSNTSVTLVPSNKQIIAPTNPKPKKSIEGKRKNTDSGNQLPPSKIYRDVPPINLPKDLPKSLSIIPTSSSMQSKILPSSTPKLINSAQITKVSKPTKPKKEPILPISSAISTSQSLPFGGLAGLSGLSAKDLTNISLMNQYNDLMRPNNKNFLNNFEQYLNMNMSPPLNKKAVQSTSTKQKSNPQKQSASNVNVSTSSKGMISVKNLDVLKEVKPQKSLQQKQSTKSSYAMPKSNIKPAAVGQSLLNTYSSTLQGLPNTSYLPTMRPSNVPGSSSIQISPTKTLQQKLAEKQRAIKDANEPALDLSRPSSASK